ncbi:fimbrial protein [Serratia sp. L9]|uniref:fimbrial protein n=1 Tax=Serratia sp. L9 TaxID=3423946 RepID=UPI003D679D48
MKGKDIALAAGLAMMGLIVPSAQAVQVNFQGGLIEAIPCTISDGELIEVDFNDMVIRDIDGVRYSKPIPYKIDCSAAGAVRLSFRATGSSFDIGVVQTSSPDLGIRITSNGVPISVLPDAYLTEIDVQSPPQLMAVPVVNPAQPPSPGAFTARAMLLAEYQ